PVGKQPAALPRAPYQRVVFPPQHSERLRDRATGNLGVQRQVTATELRLSCSGHLHGRGERAQCQPDTGSGTSPALLTLLLALSQPDRIPPRPDFLSRRKSGQTGRTAVWPEKPSGV